MFYFKSSFILNTIGGVYGPKTQNNISLSKLYLFYIHYVMNFRTCFGFERT